MSIQLYDYFRWLFGKFGCQFYGFFGISAGLASLSNLVILTIENYVASKEISGMPRTEGTEVFIFIIKLSKVSTIKVNFFTVYKKKSSAFVMNCTYWKEYDMKFTHNVLGWSLYFKDVSHCCLKANSLWSNWRPIFLLLVGYDIVTKLSHRA